MTNTKMYIHVHQPLLWVQVEAVRLIAEGKAQKITQPQEGATYECIQKKENSKVILRYIQNGTLRKSFHIES